MHIQASRMFLPSKHCLSLRFFFTFSSSWCFFFFKEFFSSETFFSSRNFFLQYVFSSWLVFLKVSFPPPLKIPILENTLLRAWKCATKNFSPEFIRKKLSGWTFQLEWNYLGGISSEGGGVFWVKRTSHSRIFHAGGTEFSGIIKKRSEMKF